VQRCPSNPQEKRRTGTEEEIKSPNSKKGKIKEIKEKMAAKNKLNGIKRKSSQGFLKGN